MIVLSIDPGAGTGIATYDTVTGEFVSEERFDYLDTCERFVWHLSARNEIQCVCENYIITARTAQLTQQGEPLQYIGVLKYETAKRGIKFTLQPPAARKSGEARLRVLGWSKRTKDGHANSAAGHLLVYLLKNNLLTEADRFKLIASLDD